VLDAQTASLGTPKICVLKPFLVAYMPQISFAVIQLAVAWC